MISAFAPYRHNFGIQHNFRYAISKCSPQHTNTDRHNPIQFTTTKFDKKNNTNPRRESDEERVLTKHCFEIKVDSTKLSSFSTRSSTVYRVRPDAIKESCERDVSGRDDVDDYSAYVRIRATKPMCLSPRPSGSRVTVCIIYECAYTYTQSRESRWGADCHLSLTPFPLGFYTLDDDFECSERGTGARSISTNACIHICTRGNCAHTSPRGWWW